MQRRSDRWAAFPHSLSGRGVAVLITLYVGATQVHSSLLRQPHAARALLRGWPSWPAASSAGRVAGCGPSDGGERLAQRPLRSCGLPVLSSTTFSAAVVAYRRKDIGGTHEAVVGVSEPHEFRAISPKLPIVAAAPHFPVIARQGWRRFAQREWLSSGRPTTVSRRRSCKRCRR